MWSYRSSVPPKNGVTGLDHLETVLPTYWSTSFAVPLIPESNLVEEDQDMKMHEEKEFCVGGKIETEISRHVDTSTFI